MDGLLQEYKTGKKILSSYKTSIFLSAITTIIGLGVLIFAKHPALKSIAIISIIGICCVVIMAQILIPFLFNLLIKNRVEKRKFPWTLSGLFKSIFAFTYFVIGCIILTVLGLLFKLIPFGKEKVKLLYHFILSKFAWSMVYIMINVKKRILNLQNANFSEPAVIISNHQSFLDILSLVMLHPKLIFLTNDWVWNSPVFGAVARMADFYPVGNGAENSLEILAKRVKHGYSIVIFPEGTRSPDGEIKRFHKGAFYLAEHLNIGILPILIHGTGYTMAKNDFLLKDGTITIKYLPRIMQDDRRFGTIYSEKAKLIGRYFKDEYKQLSIATEQPVYFKQQLIYNYLYKGPFLEWQLKLKLWREKYYQLFHELLPAKGRILDIGCGYGDRAYLLHFASKEREFTGIDDNENKIGIANNCFSKDEKMTFIFADIAKFDFQDYDAILMVDFLQHLQKEAQTPLIEKCISHLNPGGRLIIRTNNYLSGRLVKDLAASDHMKLTAIDQGKNRGDFIFITDKNELN
jgi:1-acyl-sn-glycerol-3-phosphate acyltransferase